ncbi:hypothetical protein KEJ34_07715 [Candidatus Bathyarchaeota archaeon]|nr:hypothetical protein [Candidatus Bathyarchaeota archaeon]
MVKVTKPAKISRRITLLTETVKVDTQRLRVKILRELEVIFDDAARLVRGEVTVDGAALTMQERQLWARIAGYTAQVMQSVAKGFDEREIDEMLSALKNAIDAINRLKADKEREAEEKASGN